ncbi:glucose 1-dehydrogenase [Iodidimonas sp. SYSU 1G8]|uniref:SDR family NAD(P)-dependent oxidoreductase n=1 Tax=Iodidimonas sp. SYSU 1G8 TaxID=3133967 RepID=UPI0031FE5629
MLLDNKIAIVTGGGSGIGRAAALAMAAEGAVVVIGNRSADKGEAVCHEIAQAGGTALFHRTDCSVAADCEALVARAEKEYGRLDLAFNNAGMFHETLVPIHEMSLSEFDRGIDLNLKGIFYSMKYELAAMLRAGGGVICNNASIYGVKGMAGLNWYTAAKHGIMGLTKCAALEYAEKNIRVNVICPGNTKTPPLDAATGGNDELLTGIVPMKRLARSEEIADGVVFLLSDKSSYMNGGALNVDGGMIAA